MSAATQRWKRSERMAAEIYKKYGIPASRISRGSNYSISTFDIEVENHPEIVTDSKFSLAGFRVNRLLDTIEEKYKKEKDFLCILYTRGYKEKGGNFTVSDELFSMLLSHWLGYKTKEELWDIYLNG